MSLQTRLASLIAAIGADIKQLNADVAALSGSGSGSGSGSDPWTYQVVTTSWTNSTLTGTDIVAGFAPAASTRYIIESLLSVQAAAATTGVQTRFSGPTTGINQAAIKIVSAASTTADKVDHVPLNTFQAAAAGLTTPSLLSVQAIIDVGASPGAGNLRVQGRSEVSASLVTVFPGSFMRWRSF